MTWRGSQLGCLCFEDAGALDFMALQLFLKAIEGCSAGVRKGRIGICREDFRFGIVRGGVESKVSLILSEYSRMRSAVGSIGILGV